MARALLINPSYRDSYGTAKASIVDPVFPTLGLLTVAAAALERGHEVEVLDLSYRQYDHRVVRDEVLRRKPDVVGVTATTPLMNQARDISVLVKSISRDILLVAGGAHVSALPEESLRESRFDVVAVGEGDRTLPEVLDGRPPGDIRGVRYRDGAEGRGTPPRPFVEDLDSLPLPAWQLFDSSFYEHKVSHLLARRTPYGMLEFSRGCVFHCDFCASKNTMALGLRKKSPRRCAEEVRALRRFGYREFALADDIFTSDAEWAKAVCEELIRAETGVIWTCTNGIRVETTDRELFRLMRRAGCYRVSFGFESGCDDVLKASGKGGRASCRAGREAVDAAGQAGLQTNGYFLLGLAADTEETVRATIELARSLPLTMLKFGITIPFPGTPMFREYRRQGLIRSYDWDEYFMYTGRAPFAHPRLSMERIRELASSAYRRAVFLNPRFLLRRVQLAWRTGTLLEDLRALARFILAPPINTATHTAVYFAKERWPRFDFETSSLTHYPPRPANNRWTPEMLEGERLRAPSRRADAS